MFVEFFSDHVYDEPYWPSVFRLESMILGIVLDDAQEIESPSIEAIKEQILDCFDLFRFPHGMPQPQPPHAWIEAFLANEIPFIQKLILAKPRSARLSHRDPRLALNEKRLQACMDQSDAFRSYILRFPPGFDPTQELLPPNEQAEDDAPAGG